MLSHWVGPRGMCKKCGALEPLSFSRVRNLILKKFSRINEMNCNLRVEGEPQLRDLTHTQEGTHAPRVLVVNGLGAGEDKLLISVTVSSLK